MSGKILSKQREKWWLDQRNERDIWRRNEGTKERGWGKQISQREREMEKSVLNRRVTIKQFCPRCTHYCCCSILSSPNNPTLYVQYIGVNVSKKHSLLSLNQITTYQLAQNGFIKKSSSFK